MQIICLFYVRHFIFCSHPKGKSVCRLTFRLILFIEYSLCPSQVDNLLSAGELWCGVCLRSLYLITSLEKICVYTSELQGKCYKGQIGFDFPTYSAFQKPECWYRHWKWLPFTFHGWASQLQQMQPSKQWQEEFWRCNTFTQNQYWINYILTTSLL